MNDKIKENSGGQDHKIGLFVDSFVIYVAKSLGALQDTSQAFERVSRTNQFKSEFFTIFLTEEKQH